MHPKERPERLEDSTGVMPRSKKEPQYPNFSLSAPVSYIPSLSESGQKGRFFPSFTLFLCMMAVLMEGTLHICAGMFQMDPIPSPIMLVLYILTVATIGVNNWVLNAEQYSRGAAIRQSPRGLGLLIVATVVSLVVALTAGYMFIPLAPIGGILIVAMGLGLLLWTPYFAIISLIGQLRSLTSAFRATGAGQTEIVRTITASALAAVAFLFWQIGCPMIAANYVAIAFQTQGAEQRRALNTSRPFGGETILLDLAYKRNPSYWACLGYNAPRYGWWPNGGYQLGHAFSLWGGDEWEPGPDTAQARRLYFLLTGTPFEMAPRPESFKNNPGGFMRRGPNDVEIEETGGLVVGRKIPGLSLADSRMDWTLEDSGSAGTVDWTMKFKNDTDQPQEARADILIPDNAVVHKVSLWINGVEQPARYGHPDRVREAYQEVAVVRRRDPLLVTMPAPGHVLAQCFPVPAHGEMQIRLGFTVPARPQGSIELPTLGMVNFAVPDRSYNEWLVQPTGQIAQVATRESRSGRQLFLPTYAPRLERSATATLTTPTNLYIVVDGSQGMNSALTQERLMILENALNQLPAGSQVRFFRTDKEMSNAAYWMPGQKLPNLLLSERCIGGYDPEVHLANALNQAAQDKSRPSAVLFLHGASANGVSGLERVRTALQQNYWGGPALVGIHMVPATPDTLLRELSGFPRVYTERAFPESSDFAMELDIAIQRAVRAAHQTSNEAVAEDRVKQVQAEDEKREKIDDPIQRLALYDDVLSSWRYANTLPTERALDVRIAVGKAAAHQRLVSPLSSAVVLETEEQYEENGLEKDDKEKDVTKEKDPTKLKAKANDNVSSPEPGALVLLIVGGLVALPVLRRKQVSRL